MGAYELIELDKYVMLLTMRCLNGFIDSVIKFGLIWVGYIHEMTLVSALNGYMSSESIQTSWFQVWFNLMKNSSIVEICPIFENLSELWS